MLSTEVNLYISFFPLSSADPVSHHLFTSPHFSMAWVSDAVGARHSLDTVAKQQVLLPTSHVFSAFPSDRVLRVFQLDAVTCQVELVEILQSVLFGILDIPPLQSFRFAYQEELLLGLDVLLYRFSVWRMGQSAGDRLQNLVMRDEVRADALGLQGSNSMISSLAPSRRLLLIHAVLTIIVPYAARKLNRKILDEGWSREPETSTKFRVAKALRYASITWSVLSLLNTLNFLLTGRYRLLVERLLSLRMIYGSQKMVRFSNLFYLNQHMWWNTWLSLMSVLSVGRYFRRLVDNLRSVASLSASARPLSDAVCCACHETPTICQISNCGHRYCYYCIKSRLLDSKSSGSFTCYRCGQAVHDCSAA